MFQLSSSKLPFQEVLSSLTLTGFFHHKTASNKNVPIYFTSVVCFNFWCNMHAFEREPVADIILLLPHKTNSLVSRPPVYTKRTGSNFHGFYKILSNFRWYPSKLSPRRDHLILQHCELPWSRSDYISYISTTLLIRRVQLFLTKTTLLSL